MVARVGDEHEFPEPIDVPEKGWVLVKTPEALAEAAADLTGSEALAVDTESDSFFSYRESCCLIQITGDATVDYVIDPLAIDDLSSLAPLMEDRAVTKIFHGADYDVVSLKRDFDFSIHGIFDTMIAAQATGHQRFGLNDLVQRYFGRKLDKKWQRHDWSSRPLTDAQLDYARLDSHYLHELRALLWEQAGQAGRHAMLQEEFELLEDRTWTERPFDPDDCVRVKGAKKLDSKALKILRAVHSLRDRMAEERNRPPFKVFGNEALLKLSRGAPTDKEQLAEVLGSNHHIVRRYARAVLDAVQEGLDDTGRPPRAKPPDPGPERNLPPFTRDDEPLFGALKSWRNRRADELGVGPGMVVNNTLLRRIAAQKPDVSEQLQAVPDMRRWQIVEFGDELVAELQAYLASHEPAKPKAKHKALPGPPEDERAKRRRRRRRRKPRPEAPAGGDGSEGTPEGSP